MTNSGNSQDRGLYLNANFRVEIEGIAVAGFSEVVMRDASASVIVYRTGADGPGEGRLVPGPVRHGSIVLKRGVSRDRKLEDWWQAVVRGEDARRNGAIVLMDDRREDVLRWNFVRAWPAAFAASGLDGRGREVVIETLELVHEGLRAEPCPPSRRPGGAGTATAVPVDPSHGTGRKPWP